MWRGSSIIIPVDRDEVELSLPEGKIKLAHLQKLFWSREQITKGAVRVHKLDELWKPMLAKQGRVNIDRLLH